MKKVLIIGLTERMGGVETFIYNTTVFSNKENIQYDYLVHGTDHAQFQKQITDFYGDNHHFHFVGHFKSKPIKTMWELFKFYKTHHYDAVHLQTGATFEVVYTFPYNILFGLKVICHSHNGNGFSNFQNAIFRPILNYCANRRLACSQVAADWLFGKNKGKTAEVIKNGIDVNRFTYSEQKRMRMREKYAIEDKFVVGHIGRFSEQKNHQFILKIYQEILVKRQDSILFLVGTGELLQEVKTAAVKMQLDKHIIFVNGTSSPEDYYCLFDVFLMPSLYEGLPIVGVEAQCEGLDCYFSDNISSEIAITDCCHIYSLNHTAKEWATFILEGEKKKAQRELYPKLVSQAGFSIQYVVSRLEQIYNEL